MYTIVTYMHMDIQAGSTSSGERLLNNAERYAFILASKSNVSNGEDQYRQRKSRTNIGEEKL